MSKKENGRAEATTRPDNATTENSIAEACRLGVIVRGGVAGKRELVTDWPKVLEDYLTCNEDEDGTTYTGDGEAYLSMCSYGSDFEDHHKEHGTNGRYSGKAWSPFLCMDFDCPGDTANAIAEAQEALRRIQSNHLKHGADMEKIIACFSGNKGAHLYIPLPSCAVPSEDFGKICRDVAGKLAEGCETVDLKIYDHARIFRLPNTRHPGSGKLKVPYLASEFEAMDPAAILNTDETRDAGINMPEDAGEWLVPFWKAAVNGLKKSKAELPASTTFLLPPGVGLSDATRDFIANGAPEGERNNSLFKATCELVEHRCPDSVIAGLLKPSASKCGLSEQEITTTFESAVKKANEFKVAVRLFDVCQSCKVFFESAADVFTGTDILEQEQWAKLEEWYSKNDFPPPGAMDSTQSSEDEARYLARELLELWKIQATRAATKTHKDDRGALMERLQAIENAGTLPPLYEKVHLAPPQGAPLFNNGPLPGSFGVIIGGDGIGKGFIILDLVTGYARGEAMHIESIGAIPGKRLRCCYVSYEESASDLKTRMDRVCGNKVDYAALEESGWLRFVPLPKEGLFRQAEGYGGAKTPTGTLKRLERAMTEDKLNLVIIDPVASAGGLDDENSNAEVGAFVTSLRSTAERNGCTILLIHHTSKEGTDKLDAAAGRGASALKGGARWVLNLVQDKDGKETLPFILGRITKNTHGEGCSFYLERRSGGVLAEVTAEEREAWREAKAAGDAVRLAEYIPKLIEFIEENPGHVITRGGIGNGQGKYMAELRKHLGLTEDKKIVTICELALEKGDITEVGRPHNGRVVNAITVP